jgi:hypothetical protein
MNDDPRPEHRWLQQIVGDWTHYDERSEAAGSVEAPWRETVRPLGHLWVLCEAWGNMPGGAPGRTVMTLGYDPARKRYVGTFVGSMMSNLWVYEGTMDPEGRALTLETEGPVMDGDGRIAPYRDVIELDGPDRRFLTSYMQREDGEWTQIMRMEYRRPARGAESAPAVAER